MYKKHKMSKMTITIVAAASVSVATLILSTVLPAAIPSAFAIGSRGGCGRGGGSDCSGS